MTTPNFDIEFGQSAPNMFDLTDDNVKFGMLDFAGVKAWPKSWDFNSTFRYLDRKCNYLHDMQDAHNADKNAHQAMRDDKFGGLNNAFGYKKINGLILQWGETAQIVPSNIPTNTVITSQLPIIFPNAFLTAIATPYDYTNGGFLATQLQVAINAASSTSQIAFLCRLLTATGSWCKIKYLAIGY